MELNFKIWCKINEAVAAAVGQNSMAQSNIALPQLKNQLAKAVGGKIKLATTKPTNQQKPINIAQMIDDEIANMLTNGQLANNPALAAKLQNPNPSNPMMPQ